MGNFGTFYAQGGLLMHFITVVGLAAVGVSVAGRTGSFANIDEVAARRFSERAAVLAILIGVMGSLFGLFDMCAALGMDHARELPPREFAQAAFRGLGILGTTTAYGLMWAVPLLGAAGVARLRSGSGPASASASR